MIFLPAVDMLSGQVVRLERGERSRVTVYSDDPASVARGFRDAGASWVHVVDLSSAFEEDEAARAANDEAIRAICAIEGLSVDVGGGVRSLSRIEELAKMGCARISLGTPLVRDPAFAREAAAEFAGLLAADVAARDGIVRVNGWREGAELTVDELVPALADMGFSHLVFTDIARDGMQTGIDADAYRRISELAGFPVTASGGIASLADLSALAELGEDIVEGAIAGRAVMEGAFSVEDALEACS